VDPKVTIKFADGAAWLRETSRRSTLDLLIIDSSDDDSGHADINSSLFSDEFYESAAAALTPGGVLVKQGGLSMAQEECRFRTLLQIKKLFTNVGFYVVNVPTYVGGDMTFIWGTNGPALDHVQAGRVTFETLYYHEPIHRACFCMPRNVCDRMNNTSNATSVQK